MGLGGGRVGEGVLTETTRVSGGRVGVTAAPPIGPHAARRQASQIVQALRMRPGCHIRCQQLFALVIQGISQQLNRMPRGAARAVCDLVAARHAGGGQQCGGLSRAQGREEAPLANRLGLWAMVFSRNRLSSPVEIRFLYVCSRLLMS